MLELNRVYPSGLFETDGRYSEFLARRDEFLRGQAAYEESLANTVRREIEWLRRGAKARSTKAKGRIKEAERLIEELGRRAGARRTRTAGDRLHRLRPALAPAARRARGWRSRSAAGRSCATSTSSSRPARASGSWGRTAAARPPCSTCWRARSPPTRARSSGRRICASSGSSSNLLHLLVRPLSPAQSAEPGAGPLRARALRRRPPARAPDPRHLPRHPADQRGPGRHALSGSALRAAGAGGPQPGRHADRPQPRDPARAGESRRRGAGRDLAPGELLPSSGHSGSGPEAGRHGVERGRI